MPDPKPTKQVKGKAGGRKTTFGQSVAMRIMELAKAGATDHQIASSIGISVSTLNNWKGKHPGFLEALKAAKDVADGLVEAALFSRAVGYSHPAVKIHYDPKGGEKGNGAFVSQPYIERHPPDTTACIFWLKNRQKDRWRDVHKHEHGGENGEPIRVSSVELAKAAAEAVKDAPGRPSECF